MSLSKQFTRREKVLLAVMGVVLLLGAYIWLVQTPIATQKTELTAAQLEADDELMILEAKHQRLLEMKADLASLGDTLVETPPYDNLQHVIATLNSIMAATTDYTMNFQPVVMPESGDIVRRVIDMNFTCNTYDGARNVIARLHDGPYRCQIGDLLISARPIKNAPPDTVATLKNGEVEVSLTITYFENLH